MMETCVRHNRLKYIQDLIQNKHFPHSHILFEVCQILVRLSFIAMKETIWRSLFMATKHVKEDEKKCRRLNSRMRVQCLSHTHARTSAYLIRNFTFSSIIISSCFFNVKSIFHTFARTQVNSHFPTIFKW